MIYIGFLISGIDRVFWGW
jgi:hypothetical protein